MSGQFGRAALKELLCGPRARVPRLLVRPSSGKPDAVRRRLVGEVIRRSERRSFQLVGMKMLRAPESVLAELYRHHRGKPFYAALLSHMRSGPVVAMVWGGPNVVGTSRVMVGLTDPAEAGHGTIRGDFSLHMRRNLTHASVEGAQREIRLWFQSGELVDWADDGCRGSLYPA
ncbi:nucleoside diphosphate kinase, mitochondrial-like [Pipistrellus kuhlii]|uniref:nucleoside diphosphate kinase, mitochondrial-like n=1 Tax=Pipistrellus kuhlii TaxID=59472 RepID=UPI00174F3E26|nr:nucleoside diphosphate kinase, mitochondrial-like [Pipistrellus kuhlii]